MPWERNTSGDAAVARRVSASAAVIWGTSISARKGSPSADCTVIRPKAKADASPACRPTQSTAAAAKAENFQRCMFAIN